MSNFGETPDPRARARELDGPPLMHGAEPLAASAPRRDWCLAHAEAPEPRPGQPLPNPDVARDWLQRALAAHASVATFARLSVQLLGLGAPAELVAAAAQAMQDQIRHARAAFDLARRYSTEDLGPGPLAIDGALRPTEPASIVLDTLRERCIGDTVAALEAHEALQYCEDPAARAALERIADAKGQHAELAWRFVAWAIEARPELKDNVRDAFARILAGVPPRRERHPRNPSPADRELARHGLLSAPQRAALRQRVLAGVIAPCADALLAGAGWKSPEAAPLSSRALGTRTPLVVNRGRS